MEYRLPTIEDKEIIEDYIQEHYQNNEHSLHASNMLTLLKKKSYATKMLQYGLEICKEKG